MTPRRKIAINTGGGDAPGLNAVVHAATLAAMGRGWDVVGIRHGYRGVFEPKGLIPLDREVVSGIAHLGGTILGTANRADPFHYPTIPVDGGPPVPTDRSRELVERLHAEKIEGIIAIGGDGSMRLARDLFELGLPPVVGVPKTIDNDVLGTDVTFGFDTAVSIATEALDRLHTTAEAHERVMVVEVMGRHAGWIAMMSGLAGGADVILIPEVPFRLEPIVEKIAQRERRGRPFSIVVVAEGAIPVGGHETLRSTGDVFRGVPVLGGVGEAVAAELGRRTNKEVRSLVLGHLQRGGGPSSADRVLALRFGAAAVSELAAIFGDSTSASADPAARCGMVGIVGGVIQLVPLSIPVSGIRRVPTDRGIIRSGRAIGIAFGDEPVGSFAS